MISFRPLADTATASAVATGNWQLATWQAVSAIGKPHDTDTEQHREPRALEVEEQTYAVIALPASTLT